MQIIKLNHTLIPLLKKSLEAYSIRQQAIAENMANLDTPNYKPVKITFEENLQAILNNKNLVGKKTHPRHLNIGKSLVDVISAKEQPVEVNLEEEMAELAKNQIRFEFAARMLQRSYEAIRASILGRAR